MTIFTPVVKQRVFVLGISQRNREIYSLPNQNKIGTISRGPTRDAYLWDLHSMADTFFVHAPRGFRSLSSFDRFWQSLWLTDFHDLAGSKVFQPAPTGFTLNTFNNSMAAEHVYSGGFTYSPLIAATDSLGPAPETTAGEATMYLAVAYPGYPVLFASSITANSHYGPVFVKTARFSVGGNEKLNAVSVAVEFSGGKSILCPVMPALPPEIVSQTHNDLIHAESQTYTDFRYYRSASLLDCMVDNNVYTSIAEMRSALANFSVSESAFPERRLVEMTINIAQEVNFTCPCPTPPRTDQHGPRFASITNRVVTGALTFFSRELRFDQPITTALTLYFGGPNLFPMPNVEWQEPTSKAIPGQGYLQTYEFIARAAPDAPVLGRGISGVSEFARIENT